MEYLNHGAILQASSRPELTMLQRRQIPPHIRRALPLRLRPQPARHGRTQSLPLTISSHNPLPL